MSLPLLDIILLLAAIQGVFLAALILHKHRSLYANRFLSAYMFLYSILFINLILGDLGVFFKAPYLLFFHVGVPFLIGPLHLLYAKNLIAPAKKFNYKWLVHLIPLILFEIIFLIFFIFEPDRIIPNADNRFDSGTSLFYELFNWGIMIQAAFYIAVTLIGIKKYSMRLERIFSSVGKYRLDWLRNLSLILACVLVFFLIENILLLFEIRISPYFSLTSYLAGTAVYLIGYLGLVKSEVFSDTGLQHALKAMSSDSLNISVENANQIPQQKYARSGLSAENAKIYKSELLNLMEKEKFYTNPDLTLGQLAEKLNISTHNLSEIINTRFNKNFFDFVNQYRVEEVKKQLSDPSTGNLKILSIAFDAGFNSKASFNSIFKKFKGMTPSEYRRKFGQ